MMRLTLVRLAVSVIALISLSSLGTANAYAESVRQERKLIEKGNRLYGEKKYLEAEQCYRNALSANGASAAAAYNLGLTRLVIGSNPADTTTRAKELLKEGVANMENVARMTQTHPELASKASYNLGNVAFNNQDFGQAISRYKEALRLNPADDNARRNLRIAQLKQQNQNDKNDQNQDKQNQNQDQQDKKQNQKQDQPKDNQQDKRDNKSEPQPQEGINEQTAAQILQAMENKENQTRGRVGNARKAQGARNRSNKNW